MKDVEEDRTPPMPKFEGAVEMKSTDKSIKEEKPAEETKKDSTELLSKLLSNPKTAAILKALEKSI